MHVPPLRTVPLSRHAPNAWNADAGQANARNNAAAPTCFVIMACHHQIIESQACTAQEPTLRRRCQERHPGAEARRSTGKNALYMRPRGGAYASTNPIQRNTATAVSGPGPMPHSSRSLSPSKLTANPVQKNGHPKNPLRLLASAPPKSPKSAQRIPEQTDNNGAPPGGLPALRASRLILNRGDANGWLRFSQLRSLFVTSHTRQ